MLFVEWCSFSRLRRGKRRCAPARLVSLQLLIIASTTDPDSQRKRPGFMRELPYKSTDQWQLWLNRSVEWNETNAWFCLVRVADGVMHSDGSPSSAEGAK